MLLLDMYITASLCASSFDAVADADAGCHDVAKVAFRALEYDPVYLIRPRFDRVVCLH